MRGTTSCRWHIQPEFTNLLIPVAGNRFSQNHWVGTTTSCCTWPAHVFDQIFSQTQIHWVPIVAGSPHTFNQFFSTQKNHSFVPVTGTFNWHGRVALGIGTVIIDKMVALDIVQSLDLIGIQIQVSV